MTQRTAGQVLLEIESKLANQETDKELIRVAHSIDRHAAWCHWHLSVLVWITVIGIVVAGVNACNEEFKRTYTRPRQPENAVATLSTL